MQLRLSPAIQQENKNASRTMPFPNNIPLAANSPHFQPAQK